MTFSIRPATLDDTEVLVRHRIQMFLDMRAPIDRPMLAAEFTKWLNDHLTTGVYRAWLVHADAVVAGGGGATIIPWPPGPHYPGHRLAFVYNVYTEPPFRRQGVGRLVMETIHRWSRENGVASIALNASDHGRSLYDALGYVVTSSPMMFLSL